MTPAELLARREALGLSQTYMSWLFDVKQASYSRWESGKSWPRDDTSLSGPLTQVEELATSFEDELRWQVEGEASWQTEVLLITYMTDGEFWEHYPEAARLRLPATVHRVATARVAASMRHKVAGDLQIVPWGET